MLGATTGNLGTNADSHPETCQPRNSFKTSTSYLCTTCQITFANGEEQRTHMKEPWHVHNIKRRIASLSPVTQNEFHEQPQEKVPKVKIREPSASSRSSSEAHVEEEEQEQMEDSDSEDEQSASPFQCLFCNQDFASDDAGFAENLEHMGSAHGMSIPNLDTVIDAQSLVGYLATEIRVWHECLYCGATKPSMPSIQSHMRDKRHCHLNLDREPELLDFWESPRHVDGDGPVREQDRAINVSASELRFTSGKIVESKDEAHATKKASCKRLQASARALSPGSEDAEESQLTVGAAADRPLPIPKERPGRQIARREEMGITGIPEHQRQALVLAEKKAQRSEAVARQAREWVYAKGANSQKYDQLDNRAKWGKQIHNLLPR